MHGHSRCLASAWTRAGEVSVGVDDGGGGEHRN